MSGTVGVVLEMCMASTMSGWIAVNLRPLRGKKWLGPVRAAQTQHGESREPGFRRSLRPNRSKKVPKEPPQGFGEPVSGAKAKQLPQQKGVL